MKKKTKKTEGPMKIRKSKLVDFVMESDSGDEICYYHGLPWMNRPAIAKHAWEFYQSGMVCLTQRRGESKITNYDDGSAKVESAKYEYLAVKTKKAA